MNMPARPGLRLLWGGLGAAALLAAPHLLDNYPRFVLTEVLMWGLFALGFDVIFGKAGLLNFGMSTFFGLGAYGFAWTAHSLKLGPWAGLAAGALLAALLAFLIGLLITRYAGHYFVVFTIVLSMIAFLLAMNLRWLTGADEGITLRLDPLAVGPWEFSLKSSFTKYYLVLGVAALGFGLVWKFFTSPLGRAIVAEIGRAHV
jgi:branched-chain amino acid transport system permease protein